jgi:peptidylprolyl isomerase
MAMSTKATIGIIIVIIIIVLIGWWLWKTPKQVQAPTTVPAVTPIGDQTQPVQTTAPTPTPAPTASNTPATTTSSNTTTIDGIKTGQTAEVLYTGKLTNGTVFDASSEHGNQPFSFTLGAGQVIKGWDEGVVGMKVGEERTLTIPPDLAYGANGIPGTIPPNATLIFDVTLVGIQ